MNRKQARLEKIKAITGMYTDNQNPQEIFGTLAWGSNVIYPLHGNVELGASGQPSQQFSALNLNGTAYVNNIVAATTTGLFSVRSITVAEGATYEIPGDAVFHTLNGAGVTAYELELPVSTWNAQQIVISINTTVATFVLSTADSKPIIGTPPAVLAAGDILRYFFSQADDAWYPF